MNRGQSLRKVLCVSPHFPPINAPDHQRVRMSLPYMKEFGWVATVLTVAPDHVEAVRDPLLNKTVPDDIRIIRTCAFPVRWTRLFGLGSLALRALPFLWRAGSHLLSQEEFDLVFFSTTMFPVMILGPVWKRRFGIPYVIDLHDPWLTDYYQRAKTAPPGGRFRYGLSMMIARGLEPPVMRQMTSAIVVSANYSEELLRRYDFLARQQFTTLPFGASEHDFDLLDNIKIEPKLPKEDCLQIVYVGAAGAYMSTSVRILFRSVSHLRQLQPERWRNVRFIFIGTNYAPSPQPRKAILPIAQECEIVDLVTEETNRIPYFETLATLRAADGLLIIGSDSPSYTPSKIYPYMLAGRPMLSILHERSPAVDILRRCRAGLVVTFTSSLPTDETTAKMRAALEIFREQCEKKIAPDIEWNEYAPSTAREMTRRQCAVFDKALLGG